MSVLTACLTRLSLCQCLLCSPAALFFPVLMAFCRCRACVVSTRSPGRSGELKLWNRWSTTRGVLWSLTFLLNCLGVCSVTKRAEIHICVLCAVDKGIPRTACSGTGGHFWLNEQHLLSYILQTNFCFVRVYPSISRCAQYRCDFVLQPVIGYFVCRAMSW